MTEKAWRYLMGTGPDLQGPGGVDPDGPPVLDCRLSRHVRAADLAAREDASPAASSTCSWSSRSRLSGKRLLAQLNPFDLVVILILSNTVQNAIIGNDNSITGGLLGAARCSCSTASWCKRLYSHARLQKWLEGKPDPLIEHGQLRRRQPEARKASRSPSSSAAANKQGFDSLAEIESALLAPGGALWFFRHTPTPTTSGRKSCWTGWIGSRSSSNRSREPRPS